jgi:hypothetical protein
MNESMPIFPVFTFQKVSACVSQLLHADIHALFLNPTFGVGLVLFVPACIGVYALQASFHTQEDKLRACFRANQYVHRNNTRQQRWIEICLHGLLTLHETLETCVRRVTYPLTCSVFALPVFLGGWFHLLVNAKSEVLLLASPAYFPFTTFGSLALPDGTLLGKMRLVQEMVPNYVILAHSAVSNSIWVCFEPTKHLSVQYVDWLIVYYVLLCSVLCAWYMTLHYFLMGLIRAYTGMWPSYSLNPFLMGRWTSAVLGERVHGYFQHVLWRAKPKNQWFQWLVMVDMVCCSPMSWLVGWLPMCSNLYYSEVMRLAPYYSDYCLHPHDPRLARVFSAMEQTLAMHPWYEYPMHTLTHMHMTCMHTFWQAVGLM